MSKIQVLSDILASQVAAGEVVERPASVVRELVDNALDAGSTKIEVVIHQGGQSLIRVSDNGCGMSVEDMHMSIQRHATSKIAKAEDLHDIHTRGFRGEALPSILSVSRFKLASKLAVEESQALGNEFVIDGGELKKEAPIMMPKGSIIEVKDLFYNVPARRKFLKSQGAESAQVDKLLRQLALSAPQVHFTFKRDGKLIFDWPAVQAYQERIAQSIGSLLAESLIMLEAEDLDLGLSLQAAFLPPSFASKTRKQQQFFVNQRPIENVMLSYVLRDALDSIEWRQQFPLAWIYLTVKPDQIDVNVHPAKKEIRFSQEPQVRSFVLRALSQAWQKWQMKQHTPLEPFSSSNLNSQDHSYITDDVIEQSMSSQLSENYSVDYQTLKKDVPDITASPAIVIPKIDAQVLQSQFIDELADNNSGASIISNFVPLALLDSLYLVVQTKQSQLSIIQTKFAQQRIIYDELMNKEEQTILPSQKLLLPEIIDVSVEDNNLWLEHQNSFELAGFEVEAFGVQTLQLCSVPGCFGLNQARELFLQMLHNLSEWQPQQCTEKMPWQEFCLQLTKVATHGWSLEFKQSTQLIKQLLETKQPYQSPFGKLIWKTWRSQDLERFF